MITKFIYLFTLSAITSVVMAQPTADSTRSNPAVVFKVGAGLYTDLLGTENFSFLQADLGVEAPIGSRFSVAGRLTPHYVGYDFEFEVTKTANLRYFFRKDTSPFRKPERNLSGSYVAAAFEYEQPKWQPGENSNPWTSTSDVRSFIPYQRYGFEVGRQWLASLDMAVFAGMEEAMEVYGYDQPTGYHQVQNVRYPVIRSRFTPAIPIDFSRKSKVLHPANCYEQHCVDGDKAFLKLGLQDVFSFSKAGILFYPKVSYEIPFKKIAASLNLKTETYFQRNHLFDYEYDNSTSSFYRSPEPYKNQRIEFRFSPQLKYFLFKNKMPSLSRLEGLYLLTDVTARFGTLEVRRSTWAYERYHAHSFGFGGGIQKVLAKRMMVDGFFILDKSFGSDYSGLDGLRAGIQYYWLR